MHLISQHSKLTFLNKKLKNIFISEIFFRFRTIWTIAFRKIHNKTIKLTSNLIKHSSCLLVFRWFWYVFAFRFRDFPTHTMGFLFCNTVQRSVPTARFGALSRSLLSHAIPVYYFIIIYYYNNIVTFQFRTIRRPRRDANAKIPAFVPAIYIHRGLFDGKRLRALGMHRKQAPSRLMFLF